MTYLPFSLSLSLTHTNTHSCVHIQMYDFCLGCGTCLGPIGKTGYPSWMIQVDKKQCLLMVKLGNIPPHSSNQKPRHPNSFSRTIFQNVAQETGLTSKTTRLGRHSYFGWFLAFLWASLVAQLVKNLPAVWETWVWSLAWKDPLEKGKATHSSILAWRIQVRVTKSQTQLSDFHFTHVPFCAFWSVTENEVWGFDYVCVLAKLPQSYLTLCDPVDCSLPWDSPGKNTGVGCHAHLPNPGIEPMSPAALALQTNSVLLSHQGRPEVFD